MNPDQDPIAACRLRMLWMSELGNSPEDCADSLRYNPPQSVTEEQGLLDAVRIQLEWEQQFTGGRMPPKVGIFSLTPSSKTIAACDRVKLALDWTVPAGSWHTLQYVDLRLRNLDGTLALIRFYEANNSVSLFNPAAGKFGPAVKMGSDAVLANRYLNVFLKTSTVKAVSPASPTVTLTFDIQFKNSLSGIPIVIEAAATDDLGQAQDFGYAGTLNVLKRRGRF